MQSLSKIENYAISQHQIYVISDTLLFLIMLELTGLSTV